MGFISFQTFILGRFDDVLQPDLIVLQPLDFSGIGISFLHQLHLPGFQFVDLFLKGDNLFRALFVG